MRKQLAKIALAASLVLALAFTLSCGNHSLEDLVQEDTPSSSSSAGEYSSSDLDIFAVDISQETEEWNYMVVAKDGSSMFIDVDESSDIPTRMFLKPDKNSDEGFSLFFKEDGLPDKMVVDGYILYFGNFNGYKYDLAIIYSDNRIEYHYGIETDVDWDAYRMAPKAMLLRLSSSLFNKITKSIISVAVPAVTCGVAVFVPGLTDACASGVVKLAAKTTVETVFDGFTEDVGKVLVDMMFCASGNWGSCVSMLYSSVSLRSQIDYNLTVDKTTQINEASRKLDGNGKSSSSTFGSSSSSGGGSGSGCEIGGYRTVVIGEQVWMAENFNCDVDGSKCYKNDPAYCEIYGRLYYWVTAMALPDSCNTIECASQVNSKHRGICPSGWHIPSNADWDKLMRYVDGSTGTSSPYHSSTAGRYLKATSGWDSNGNGTDKYGFSALPGSSGLFGSFTSGYIGRLGLWWSSSESGSSKAYSRYMGDDGYYAKWASDYKEYLYSVRCLQD